MFAIEHQVLYDGGMPASNEPLNDAIRQAIDLMGGTVVAAQKLRIAPQNFYNWINRENVKVPTEHCVTIELETSGAVTRKQLRPDDWWAHWPDLPGASRARVRALKAA